MTPALSKLYLFSCRKMTNVSKSTKSQLWRLLTRILFEVFATGFSNRGSLLLNTKNDSTPGEISFSQQKNEVFNSKRIKQFRSNKNNISNWRSHSVNTRSHQILGLSTEIDTLQSSTVDRCILFCVCI